MRRLLWIGDAAVATGFARCTHKTLEALRHTWDVHVLGLNYLGDPHKFPYSIYPCWPGNDMFGLGRLEAVLKSAKPDMIVIQNDPWNVPAYLDKLEKVLSVRPPIVASMPVDGKNCCGSKLNRLDLAVFWTKFGLEEARLGGYTGRAAVIPLGVDLELYKPMDRLEARKKIGLPEEVHDVFIFGNVNRNQPRKRLDLTVQYFAEWAIGNGIKDAYLFLMIAPTGDIGYGVQQLMQYYGMRGDMKRLILVEPDIGVGYQEEVLPSIYSCFDAQVSTTQGEGWGLTTMEGMACGVPQIVPHWSALGEWCGDAVCHVRCSNQNVTPNYINVVGGVPDKDEMITAMDRFYRDPLLRESYAAKGQELVACPEFRWESVGHHFAEALERLC